MTEEKQLSHVLRDLGETSSLHGVPKIIASPHLAAKALWCLLLIGAIGLSTYQIVQLFMVYYSFPVTTDVTRKYGVLPFPAFTICNSNPVRYSKLIENKELLEVLADVLDFNDSLTFGRSETNPSFKFRSYRDRVYMTFMRQPDDVRYKMGHQLLDMLYEFNVVGSPYWLKYGQSSVIYSPLYGNCFPIHLNEMSRTSGPAKGLEMVLNIEKEEYMDNFIYGYGMRLSIHQPGVYPLPDGDSIVLSPGFETNIGLRLVRVNRLGGVYGKCTTGEGYMTHPSMYSVSVCNANCLARHIHYYCGCVPYESPPAVENTICDVDNGNVTECVNITENLVFSGQLTCDCPPKCNEESYSMTISTRRWPHFNYLKNVLLLQACNNKHPAMNLTCQQLEIEGWDVPEYSYETYATNFIKVNIYYEELSYESISESPLYDTVSFLSDLGGVMGFYLGASLLTYVETLQVMLELCLYVKSKVCRVRASPIRPENTQTVER